MKKAEENSSWKKAMDKSAGEKIKDDEALLKKSIKRQEQRKKASKKRWEEREEGKSKRMEARQTKRKENIKGRKEQVKKGKMKKAAKKGRVVVPGFR